MTGRAVWSGGVMPMIVLSITLFMPMASSPSDSSPPTSRDDVLAGVNDGEDRSPFARRTSATGHCTRKADWRIRVLPSTDTELAFQTVRLLDVAPRSRWHIVNQKIRGDDTDVEIANIRASDNRRLLFADELSHPGRVLIDFVATATESGQSCAFTLSLRA